MRRRGPPTGRASWRCCRRPKTGRGWRAPRGGWWRWLAEDGEEGARGGEMREREEERGREEGRTGGREEGRTACTEPPPSGRESHACGNTPNCYSGKKAALFLAGRRQPAVVAPPTPSAQHTGGAAAGVHRASCSVGHEGGPHAGPQQAERWRPGLQSRHLRWWLQRLALQVQARDCHRHDAYVQRARLEPDAAGARLRLRVRRPDGAKVPKRPVARPHPLAFGLAAGGPLERK